jgi:hypothetical protein
MSPARRSCLSSFSLLFFSFLFFSFLFFSFLFLSLCIASLLIKYYYFFLHRLSLFLAFLLSFHLPFFLRYFFHMNAVDYLSIFNSIHRSIIRRFNFKRPILVPKDLSTRAPRCIGESKFSSQARSLMVVSLFLFLSFFVFCSFLSFFFHNFKLSISFFLSSF